MEYNLIILIAVILLFLIYQKFQNTESLNNINSPESIKFLDETILRIRCQYKSFDWEEPYLEQSSKESIGSGFFIDDKGHILTNYHVVEEAIKVFVQIPKLHTYMNPYFQNIESEDSQKWLRMNLKLIKLFR